MAGAGNASDATAMSAMSANGMGSSGSQSLYTPPELATSGIAGTGGYVSQPSQYISGMEAGSNLFNNWEASQRGRIAFGEEQTSDVMGMMGGMGAMQEGGVVPPPTRAPGAGVQAIPVPTQSQVPMNGPNGQGSPAGMQRGGPVKADRAIPPPFLASAASRFSGVNGSHQATPGMSGYEQGGAVAGYDAGGTVTPDPSGALSAAAASSGVIPPQGAAPGVAPAVAAGGNTQTVVAPAQQQGDAQTVVPPPQGGVPPLQQGAAPPSQAAAQQNFEAHVENAAGYLRANELNDDGVPYGKAGVPGTPSQYDVTGKVSPHSLPPDFWDKSDSMIRLAAGGAALAGHNPAAVYGALDAMRTSYVQSHMVRWLSVASRAQLDGNTDEMIQALRNANYYLPDGKNLEIHKDANGKVMFQDPIYPYVDAKGQPIMYAAPGAKPNMIEANQEYIQLVGQSMLNPMGVQQMIMGSRAAMVKQQQELMQARGQELTGEGRYLWGKAAEESAGAKVSRIATQNYRDLAAADLDRARAASSQFALKWLQNAGKVDPAAAKAATDAANGIDDLALGPRTQAPVSDAKGNPSLSPAAGKVIHDSSRADPGLARASAQDIAVVKSWASGLVYANPRGITPQFADSVAAAAYARLKQSHKGPDGKSTADVQIDQKQGLLHIWDPKGKKWNNFPMAQGAAVTMGSVPPGLFVMAAGVGAGASSPVPSQGGSDEFANPPEGFFEDNAGSTAPQ